MNSWKYCIFILLLYKSDTLSNVLCKTPTGGQKPTRGENNKKASENKTSEAPTKADGTKTETKTPKNKQALKVANNDREPTKAASTDQLPQNSGSKTSGVQRDKKSGSKDTIYKLIDVDLERIDPNSFFISESLHESNCYKMVTIPYITINSIRFGGRTLWIKNEKTFCYTLKIYNIGGNSALVVLEAVSLVEDPNFINIVLSNISSDEEGHIGFTHRYIGLFEAFYELNRNRISKFQRRMKLDIGDEFDKLYYKYSSSVSEASQGDSGTVVSEYELFEHNENQIFVEVECGSSVVWKSLKVGAYEFGTKKVEVFTITTTNPNSRASENARPKLGPKPSADDAVYSKDKAAKEDAVHKDVIKLVQITIRNNYYHHLIHNREKNEWEVIKKPEFDRLYLKYDLKKLVSGTIKDTKSGSTKASEMDGHLASVDDNYVVDISKENSLFSYSRISISNFQIITLTLKESEGSETASQDSIIDLAERGRIFHIYYKEHFLCYLFGTKFSITLIKNQSGLFVEMINVTSAGDINNETRLHSKAKAEACSSGERSGASSDENTDSESETSKSAKSNDTEFSFVNFDDDVIFTNYYFRWASGEHRFVKVGQRGFDTLLSNRAFNGVDRNLLSFSHYSFASRWSSIAKLPVGLRLKLNPNLNPGDFIAEEKAAKAQATAVSQKRGISAKATDDHSDYANIFYIENNGPINDNAAMFERELECTLTFGCGSDPDGFRIAATAFLIVASLLLQLIM